MKEEKINIKSDISAKNAFSELLSKKGYTNIKIVSSPADIIAFKNGKLYYFEIKFTNKKEIYFGAATLTEWTTAIKNIDNFKFIIARKEDNLWDFKEYGPLEFMQFNTIPPFKTYFNISLNNQTTKKKNKKAILLNKEKLNRMEKFWNSLKD